MGPLTRDNYKIDVLTAAVMLVNIHKAAQSPTIGFTDAYNTLDMITRKFNGLSFRVDKSSLESGLWACNMLSEKKKFWHPWHLTFDQFVNRIVQDDKKFDKTYNIIEEKD